jgi:transcriptional regulator with XRE-family HTH domain
MKNIEFGKYLKDKRLAVDLSQGDVAQALGYTSPQFISNWERDLSRPPMKVIYQLCVLYKIPREEITNILMEEHERMLKATFDEAVREMRSNK